MSPNGCAVSQGYASVNSRPCKPVLPCSSVLCYSCQMPAKVAVSGIHSFWRRSLESSSWLARGMPFTNMSAASSLLLSGGQNLLFRTIPVLPRLRKSSMVPQATKEGASGFRYPPMTRKPRWWWRTLSCVSYLLPLHQVWMYAQTAYNLHHFFELFEFYTYPFLMAIGRLPRWSLIAYFLIAYLTVVRRKEWPHFFRFHVAMGMLLEIALQVTGIVSRWMPRAAYWGKLGMHFWTTAFFVFLFTVLECIRCALVGMYADIPFVCDAAYIQIPYE